MDKLKRETEFVGVVIYYITISFAVPFIFIAFLGVGIWHSFRDFANFVGKLDNREDV